MGINDEYVSLLVDTFYTRIRQHAILGPIFDNAIGDNWDAHLARMKSFWSSVTMNSGQYSGKPVPAHQKHSDVIQDWHFGIWLGLFKQTLEDTAPSSEAIDYFMVRAERIAKSLKLAIFGMPGLGAPRYA
jgi:hemoglobin